LALPSAARQDLDRALDRGLLTVRGHDRVLRLAWTEADLDGCTLPTRDHVGRALLLRTRGRVAA
ncbi:MAG TPA: ATP-binding protein, partial [Kineosporiaceae bacterium]|nr:ATP-binding protein [Kineosporiaceae bacterium]